MALSLTSSHFEFPYLKMNYIESLPLAEVEHLCSQSRPGKLRESYCFELFRRAIVDSQQECWDILFVQYKKLVYHWIQEANQNNLDIGESALDDIVLDTFTTFWRVYNAEKLERANGLGSILRYLKSCASSSILLASRKALAKKRLGNSKEHPHSNETTYISTTQDGQPDSVLYREEADRLWTIVYDCCHDEKDRIIAWHSLAWGKKPAQILDEFEDLFADIEEIGNRRRSLKNRLLRNNALRNSWGS